MKSLFTNTPSGSWLIAICALGLLAIWPLPGTIALRHTLLGVGFVASICYLYTPKSLLLSRVNWPFWVFSSFYGWLLLHLMLFSSEFDLQRSELLSVWLRALLALPLGLALGMVASDPTEKYPTKNIVTFLILMGFSGTCLIGAIYFGEIVWRTQQLINYDVLFATYKAKSPFVICAALSLPLCFILIIRAINLQMSRWWMIASIVIISLNVFAVYFSNTKNGFAIFGLVLALFLTNLFLKIHWEWQKALLSFIVVSVIVSLSFVGIKNHIQKNMAWPALIADIQIGIDIENQSRWKNRNIYPSLSNRLGKSVDTSTYERTAWFTAGITLIKENPLGYGLLHHSFGALALAKWPDFYKPVGNLRGATHSAWMDFALGLGIPGLLLVLIPLWASWYRSLSQEGIWFSYTAWTVPIFSFAYLITEANGAHFTELLFFMVAFFCGITLRKPNPNLSLN